MQIPNQVNNFSIWVGGNRFIGMADVTLPNLANMTDTLKGAGLGGEIDFPVAAHYADWEATFNFQSLRRKAASLCARTG